MLHDKYHGCPPASNIDLCDGGCGDGMLYLHTIILATQPQFMRHGTRIMCVLQWREACARDSFCAPCDGAG